MEQVEPTPTEEIVPADKEKLETEFSGIVEGLNEPAIQALLEKHVARSGGDEEVSSRFVPMGQVGVEYFNENALAHYRPHPDRKIEIFSKTIDKSVRDLVRNDAVIKFNELHDVYEQKPTTELYEELVQLRNYFLSLEDPEVDDEYLQAVRTVMTTGAVIHEELHAMTDDEYRGFEIVDTEGVRIGSTSKRIGLQQHNYQYRKSSNAPDYSDSHVRFRGINEAITEIMAQRLTKEYVTQFPPEGISSGKALSFIEKYNRSYTRERWVAEQLITIFSVVADVPNDVVEQAFYRAYVNREDFLVPELVEALQAEMPDESAEEIEPLLKRLQSAIEVDSFKSDSTVYEVYDEIISRLPQEKQTRIKDTFGELYEEYARSPHVKE